MHYDTKVVIDYYNEIGLTLIPEFKFSNEQGYRFDFLHVPSKVAIEVQGGIWLARGGHSTGAGITRDMAKENLALSLGYRVFKCVPTDLCMDDTRAQFQAIVEVALGGQTRSEREHLPQRSSVPNDNQEQKRRPAPGNDRGC